MLVFVLTELFTCLHISGQLAQGYEKARLQHVQNLSKKVYGPSFMYRYGVIDTIVSTQPVYSITCRFTNILVFAIHQQGSQDKGMDRISKKGNRTGVTKELPCKNISLAIWLKLNLTRMILIMQISNSQISQTYLYVIIVKTQVSSVYKQM